MEIGLIIRAPVERNEIPVKPAARGTIERIECQRSKIKAIAYKS
jgi:hypothetical protein